MLQQNFFHFCVFHGVCGDLLRGLSRKVPSMLGPVGHCKMLVVCYTSTRFFNALNFHKNYD